MSTSLADNVQAEVLYLADRRRQPRTLIICATMVHRNVHRHIGINDAMSLNQVHEVLRISFGFHSEQTPWSFRLGTNKLNPEHCIHQYLMRPGDTLLYHWGLWAIELEVIDSYPRDRGTPEALCIGGAGSINNESFTTAEINAKLTGTATIDAVLSLVQEPVRDIIKRSRIFDYVSLLQALDLNRSTSSDPNAHGDPHLAEARANLPIETSPAAQDAFWCCVLALATLTEATFAGRIIEESMAALGWVDDDGSLLTSVSIRKLCAQSLQVLAELGGYGKQALAPVDRLEIYRALLRA